MNVFTSISLLFTMVLVAAVGCSKPDVKLTAEERAWLDENNNSIVIASDPNYPPIDFIDETGVQTGLAFDLIKKIESTLDFKFKRAKHDSWNEILDRTHSGEIRVLSAAMRTPEREEYLWFSEPFIEIPTVIITRDEYDGPRELAEMHGLTFAIIVGFPQYDLIMQDATNTLLKVTDPADGLRAVSFRKADAVALNLATASYYIESDGISNLKVHWRSEKTQPLSVAVDKNLPYLSSSIAKALSSITTEEKEAITTKWLTLSGGNVFFSRSQLMWALHLLGLLTFLLIAVLLWNRSLTAKVRSQTKKLQLDLARMENKDFQLLQAQKMEMVGTLAGGLAHDFNNVLVGILGSISSMKYHLKKKGTLDRPEIEKYTDIIEHSAHRASDVVQRLLSLSQSKDILFDAVDINVCLTNVLRVCQSTLHNSIKQEIRPSDVPAIISADPSLLEQVLLNLIVNSAQAMTVMRPPQEKHGGMLTISIKRISTDAHFRLGQPEATFSEYWSVRISDTGVGMSKETRRKIFDPFFTIKESGTGLGLAMVYTIVEQHGGYIDVFSEVGVGTTFNLNFPVFSPENTVPEPAAKRDSVIPRGEGLILVIDDDQTVSSVARSILEECGYSVITALNGAVGYELFKKNQADISLILLDLVMPVKSGLEFMQDLVKLNSSTRVILTSGFKQDERVTAVMSLGARAFIEKPYTFEQLANTVRGVLQEDSSCQNTTE